MVIKQRGIIGKIKKFSPEIQRLFALSNQFQFCEKCKKTALLFRPFDYASISCKCQKRKETHTPRLLGQTYPQWKVMCDVQKLHSLRLRRRFKNRAMYILPLGNTDDIMENKFDCKNSKSLMKFVIKYTTLFFHGMDVKLLSFQNIESLGFTMRINKQTSKKQVLVTGEWNFFIIYLLIYYYKKTMLSLHLGMLLQMCIYGCIFI